MRTMYTTDTPGSGVFAYRHIIISCICMAGFLSPAVVHAQCDTEAQGVITYCNAIGFENFDGYFVGFRVISFSGDTLDVVDLEGNNLTNRGKRIDDINTDAEPTDTSTAQVMIAGGADSIEYWYFGPFENGDAFDIVLVDPDGICDTVPVASGMFACEGLSPTGACDTTDVPLWFLDFSFTEFTIGGGGGVNENIDEVFLVMERSRVATCCDISPSSSRCFEFIVRLGPDDLGLLIDDVGSGSTGGFIYADSLSGFECTGTTNTTWPFQQDNGQSADVEPLCLISDVKDYIVITCKPGANETSATIDAVGSIFAPPDATVEPCNVELSVNGSDSVMWSSDDDPNLDNFMMCTPDSTSCTFLYDTMTFGDVTVCAGDTFTYVVCGMPGTVACFDADTTVCDTTFVIVFPVFTVEIDSSCNQQSDSLVLTAIVSSPAPGCEYNYTWSTGDTTETVTVDADGSEISVTVTRTDLPEGAQGCVIAADTITASLTFSLDCSNITDMSFQCADDIPDPDPSLLVVSGCGTPGDTIITEVSNGGAGCIGDTLFITRHYIIDLDGDAMTTGDQDTCTQLFTVVDDTAPSISCPGDVTVSCDESTAPGDTGFATATDNCDASPAIDFTDNTTPGACSDESVIMRTWIAIDECGNSSTCVQTITVTDDVSPQITCPADVTVDCEDSTDPGSTGSATATDNCDSAVSITFSDTNTPGACDQGGAIERTWMATDNCGNSATCVQVITIDDSTPPDITCPADVTVSCDESTDPANTGSATATDNCDDSVEITFEDSGSPGDCQIMRTWTATDDCGNTSTCVQSITIGPADPDDIIFPPDIKGADALHCFPPPDTTPAATGTPEVTGTDCDVFISRTDEIVDLCSGGFKIIRTWTVSVGCGGIGNGVDSVQIIEVTDTTGPVVEVPDTLFVSAMSGCMADVELPEADVTEDCSDEYTVRMEGPFGTIEQNGALVEDLEMGCHQIIYIATNDCNKTDRDTLIVCIIDDVPPSAICKNSVTIPLNNNGMALIDAEAFDGGSNDNCSPVHFKVRRMDAPVGYECFAGDNDAYLFDDVIKFCCEDIPNNDIMVVLRVYDVEPPPGQVSDGLLAGHFTECMIQVEVQDKIPPQITCPTDLTVSCIFPFDMENLSVFGEVATAAEARDSICIDDPGNPGTDGLTCVGVDGLATDNCNVEIEEEDAIFIEELCGTGTIVRTFTATDDGGLTATCTQVITIINFTPFTEGDIVWPPDFETADICEVGALDPEDLPPPFNEPVVTQDVCDLVTFTYDDVVFDFSSTSQACFKILRTWTVIDWCQYNAEEGTGIWSDVQVIKVNNTTGPDILSVLEDQTICTDDPLCGPGNVLLEATAEDDCTDAGSLHWSVAIDLDSDLSIDEVSGDLPGGSISFPVILPLGTHRILYTVEDRCGNATTEEQVITMVSCKPPSAKCQNITTTLMPVDSNGDGEVDGGMVEIWASDLDAGSDHACGHPVQVAFSDDVENTSMIFDCDDLGANPVQLWVIDINGNTDFCTVTVTVQDNNVVCNGNNGDGMGIIAGEIISSSSLMMDDVMVELQGSGLQPQHTQAGGQYAFPQMPFGGQYAVKPVLDSDHVQGVSTIDLIRIQKHLLGLEFLSTPYQMIAADANRSGTISATDIVELKKLILGIIDELPDNTSWRFVDAGYQFIDPNDPLSEDFPEIYEIPEFATDMIGIDFVGVKVGDVNESALLLHGGQGQPPQSGLSANPVVLSAEDISLEAGESYTVDLALAERYSALGLQFTLQWDPQAIRITHVSADGAEWNPAVVDRGYLPLVWSAMDAQVDQGQIVTLHLTARTGGKLSEHMSLGSAITPEEAVNASGSGTNLDLVFHGGISGAADTDMVLHQNVPNPFDHSTVIPFELKDAREVTLTVHDAMGRILTVREMDAVKGHNEFILEARDLRADGLLFYTLQTQFKQETKRMIIVNE